MKRKNQRKRFIIGAIAIFLALLMILPAILSVFAQAAESGEPLGSNDILIEADIGVASTYKLNTATGVKLNLKNSGEDFAGRAEVLVNIQTDLNQPPSYNVFSYELELASGSAKSVSFDIEINAMVRSLTIRAVDSSGRIKGSLRKSVIPSPPNGFLIGTLTDTPGELNYLGGHNISSGERLQDSMIELSPDDVVLTSESINLLGIIIINNYTTSQISPEVWTRIEGWVTRGGRLFIGTGAGYDKVAAGLPQSIASITYNGEVETNQEQSRFLDISVDGAEAVTDSGVVIYHTMQKGGGTVSVFASSLDAPVITESDFSGMAGHIDTAAQDLADEFGYNQAAAYSSYTPTYMQALGFLPDLTGNMLNVIFWALAVYVIVLTPLVYIVLRVIKRRELGLIVIPAMSIVMIFAVLILSNGTAYSVPIINSIGITKLSPGTSSAEKKIMAGLFVPRKGDRTLENTGLNVFPYVENDPYYGGSYNGTVRTGAEYNLRLNYGQNTSMGFYERASWEGDYIKTSQTVDLGGEITVFQEDAPGFKGTLTNGTNLYFDQLSVLYDGEVQTFRDVIPGQSFSFDLHTAAAAADLYQIVNEIVPEDYSGNQSGLEFSSTRRKNLLVTEALLDSEINRYTGSQMYGVNRLDGLASSSGSDSYTVIALNEDPNFSSELIVNKAQARELAANIYIQDGDVTIQNQTEISVVPLDSIVSTKGGFDYHGGGELAFYEIAEQAELQYLVPQGDTSAYDLTVTIGANAYTKAEIYNNSSDIWESFTDGAVLPLDTYTNADNYVRIRLEIGVNDAYVTKVLPTLNAERR